MKISESAARHAVERAGLTWDREWDLVLSEANELDHRVSTYQGEIWGQLKDLSGVWRVDASGLIEGWIVEELREKRRYGSAVYLH